MIYGYGYGYPTKKIGVVFNPLTDIDGLELYLNKKNATVSSWLDQSTNAFDFVQATGSKQPTISANTVDFDGVADVMSMVSSDPFSADTSGIVFFSGIFDNTNQNRYLTYADGAVNNEYLEFQIFTDGTIRLAVNNSGAFNDIRSTNTIPNEAYYFGYIKSTGAAYEISLNGVVETLNIVSGSNDGTWFGDLIGIDSISLGANLRLTNAFGNPRINKTIITNDHTISNISDINDFMSVIGN